MPIHVWFQMNPEDVKRPAADVLADLQSSGEPFKDGTLITYVSLARKFGKKSVSEIDEVLKQIPSLGWVRLSLAGTGLDFSDQQVQDGLDELVQQKALTAEVGQALKQIGVTFRTKWEERFGEELLPTLEEILVAQKDFQAPPPPAPQEQILLCVNITDGVGSIAFRQQTPEGANDVFSTRTDNIQLDEHQTVFVTGVLSLIEQYLGR